MHHLSTGAVQALFDPESGFLRHIRVGATEILRGVYVAVRDANWNTIPARMSDLRVRSDHGHLEVTFAAHHLQPPIDFHWLGRLRIDPAGTIRYDLDGIARTEFQRNRIGFCLLHSHLCAGEEVGVGTIDGRQVNARFPSEISPHQPFLNLRSLRHQPAPGLTVTVQMEGDTFEMEDQRNWTDASFKTYCTPLGLPFPVRVKAGTRITQAITIRIEGTGLERAGEATAGEPVRLVARPAGHPTRLPPIGLACARSGPLPLPAEAVDNLRTLKPAHLRVDLFAAEEGSRPRWQRGLEQARALGARLEIALHLGPDPAPELAAVRELLEADEPPPPVARVLVFSTLSVTTPSAALALARETLQPILPDAAFGGGTDAYFAEINRNPPPASGMDFVVFSINPQVHAFDDLSLVETLPIQGLVVRNAARMTGLPVVVSPVSLRPRFNPNATGPEPAPRPGERPSSVDPRQGQAFGAAWTVGSIKALSEAGAHALTLFETIGGRGVIADPTTADWLDCPSAASGDPLPPFAVLRELAGWEGAAVIPLVSSEPLKVEGLMLQQACAVLLLLANFSGEELDVRFEPVQSVAWDSLRILNDSSPHRKPATNEPLSTLHLNPHSVLSLNGTLSSAAG